MIQKLGMDRLSVNGRGVEVRWWPGVAPPLVLLHEGLGSVSLWREFPAQLAERTRRAVMAYSRLGHGESDPPPAPLTTRFMHDEAREGLPALLDGAAIDRPVLFGHSDGGSIALIFAALYPERVGALVLEAPHVFVEDVSIASIAAAKERYRSGDLRERLRKYHRDVDVAFAGWNDVWLNPAFRAWNLEEYLPRVTCPALLMQGERDEYGTLAQVEAIRSGVAGPIETLILPDCGHSPHREQPEQVLSTVTRFLGSIRREQAFGGT